MIKWLIGKLIAKTTVVVALIFVSFGASAAGDYWNTTDRLNRRTCPSTSCGIVGQLFFRGNATVFEQRDGWSRISKYYDAACRNSQSEFVDSGNKNCVPSNGIRDGKFAEWVASKYLSKTRPPDPSANAQGDEVLVKGSDDYRRYKAVFVKAAKDLVSSGSCKRKEFIEMGGWTKSSNHRAQPIYFLYCGGSHVRNRIYLDASSGQIFR